MRASCKIHAPPYCSSERIYERLVAPSPNSAALTCLGRPIGAYQDLVRHCWNQADMFEPSLVPAQSLDFLKWYLSLYGRMRGAHRAPLSADDIAFLTDPSHLTLISPAFRRCLPIILLLNRHKYRQSNEVFYGPPMTQQRCRLRIASLVRWTEKRSMRLTND